MEILNKKQIDQKLNRLAIEIVENHFDEKEIVLAGINNNGLKFAKLLQKRLSVRAQLTIACYALDTL